MFKKATALVLSAALLVASPALSQEVADELTSAFTITSHAADTIIYDGDTMTEFSSRTPETVAQKYSEAYYAGAGYTDGDPSTYYTVTGSAKYPYNEGVLTDDTLLCMQEMTNFYRWLVGSKPLSENCEQTPSLQYQALDRNFEFNHVIHSSSKPADMSQELWDKGFACNHNILAGGYTPLGAITGWMNEGYDLTNKTWTALGHREVLIHPDHVVQQFGYCGNIGLGAYDYNASVSSRNAFYAFPAPGYNPSACLNASESAWSIGLDLSKVTYSSESDISITVTNLSTNLSYTCTKTNGRINFEDNSFIGFVQPSDYNTTTGRYDSNYKVVVTGLKDKSSSKPVQIQYTVKFFELKDYAAGSITKAGLSFNNIKIYNDTFDSTDALKKLGACLPQYVTITNEFGSTAKIRTKSAWILDESDSCWYNSVNPSDIPLKFVDTTGILNKIKIHYEYTEDEYCQYNTLTVSPAKPNEGAEVKFTIYRTYYNLESSALCQIVTDGNGGYICKKTYSSLTSPEFDKQNSGIEHYYYIDAEPEDSGQYISIYYSTQDYWMDAYVCTSARSLTVNHSYELISSKDATCTEKGEKVYKCSVCGNTYTEYSDILGHSYTGKPVDATCTEQGYTRYTCTRCGDEMIGSYTPAKGHSWGSWNITTPATCTTDGVQTHSCSVCGTTETQPLIAPGHKYPATGTTVLPTCTEQGYTQFTCSVCGNVHKADYVPANGHSWGEWAVTDPSTCSKEGSETRICTVCKKTDTRAIPKLDHQLVYVRTVLPTCEDEGYDLYACANCDQYEHRNTVAASGHTYGDWTVTVTATCKNDGEQTHTCTKCSKSETKTIPKLDHSLKFTKTVLPTCTEQGYDEYTCEVCGDKVSKNFKAASGHSYGDWTTTVQATCTAQGTQKRTCSKCAAYETKPVDMLDHDLTVTVTDPTCTEQGYTRWACKNCSYVRTGNYVTETGHLMSDWTTIVQPTCSETGTAKRTCSACGYYETKTVATTEHSFTIKTYLPTCTEQGYTEHTCSVCSYSYKDNYTQTVSHKYSSWVTVESTPAQSGGRYRTCSVCGHEQRDTYGKVSLRLAGSSRYDTAFSIADRLKKERGGKAFDSIIIASGMNFADALSATYLAKVKNAPILITANTDETMNSVVSYIRANASSTASVYIVGGAGAVSADMENKLKAAGIKAKNIVRLAGSNRYLTNIAVLEEAGVTNEELLIASGMGYADALSASAVGKPIFLVSGNGLTSEQKSYLSSLDSTAATIIGGTGAVSAGIEKELRSRLKTVDRLGGKSRFDTSVLVAEKYFDDPPTIALAYGLNYPDGLCGGPLAMQYGCPLILTTSSDYAAAKNYAAKIKATSAVTFGGSALIGDKTVTTILSK